RTQRPEPQLGARAPPKKFERAPSFNRHSYSEKSVSSVKRRCLEFRECASSPKTHGTPDGEQFSKEVLYQCSYLRASAHISGSSLPTWWGIYHLPYRMKTYFRGKLA